MFRLSSQLNSDTSRLQCAEVDFRRIKGDTKQRGVVRSAGNFRPTIRFTHTAIIEMIFGGTDASCYHDIYLDSHRSGRCGLYLPVYSSTKG
jgi:hypothetical protein